ncbi:hypothetical protein [Niallia circulans]|nr:hypothetical protein [Niallia circulans]
MVFIEEMKATFSMESAENGVHQGNESHFWHEDKEIRVKGHGDHLS